jgi:cholesterol transport system auxiliary component
MKTILGKRHAAAALALAFLCGCSALQPLSAPVQAHYSLSDDRGATPATAAAPGTGLTLIVNPAHAEAGFDSPNIIYLRQANKLEYFSQSEWVDTPARMLTPLVMASVERSGAFRAVVQGPSTVAGDLRLDVEILRLQQEFMQAPSGVRFAVRAVVEDTATRRVLAARNFETFAPASSETAQGGVQAANQAVRDVLDQVAAFCAQAAADAPPRDRALPH